MAESICLMYGNCLRLVLGKKHVENIPHKNLFDYFIVLFWLLLVKGKQC